ncbi:hypothetical protein [Xylanibacter ruminicola]|nr:hypothetical protein [Xylanibacter ruminicola]
MQKLFQKKTKKGDTASLHAAHKRFISIKYSIHIALAFSDF